MTITPAPLLAICLVTLWLSAYAGAYVRSRRHLGEGEREHLGVILTATLTLLGLILGFSFSMAVSRYDQRKSYEEEEANAIGTEYVRAGLLPAPDATNVRHLLKNYLDQRILFYGTHDTPRLKQINNSITQLQSDLWSTVQSAAKAQPTPVTALAVSGMNDVLNSQGYAQAAFWNRIPTAAWCLMLMIAVCAHVLVGYHAQPSELKPTRFLFLPLIVSVAFFLIADLDSPRRGIIRVVPQNLISLSSNL
ncbi:MAG: hypothetical protein JO108_31530 [Acidobacteriaceae bacterium]|nr:hypothetical protein [Acidobacteriaceae bacterium]